MPSQASVTLAIQYTPPSAPVNSGVVSYPISSNYNAQNVGALDILTSITAPHTYSIPFGSISTLKMFILKNLMATDIGVRINGGQQLAQASVDASITVGASVVVSGLSGMVAAMVGGTLTITGAATSANNGTFPIASFISSTSVSITNPSAATDGNNGSIKVVANALTDNFRLATGGEMMYAGANAPSGEPITSVDVIATAIPLVIENIQYFVFGD